MNGFSRLWYPTMPAQRLAALRILIGVYGVVYLLSRAGALVGVTRYSVTQFRPVGLAAGLQAPVPAAVVYASVAVALVSGVCFVAGWRYRWTGPLYAAALLWVTSYRNSWGMVFHTENLLVLHTVILGVTPAADAWSRDAKGRELPADSGRYGWGIALMCAVTAGAYFIAGYTKLSNAGLSWATSDTLRNFVAYDNVRKIELGATHSAIGGWLVRHDWLFPPLAGLSLIVELGAPLTIFSRRLGQIWSVAAWGFHFGVLVMMFILFHYPLLGIAFIPFFDVEKAGRRLAKRFSPMKRA